MVFARAQASLRQHVRGRASQDTALHTLRISFMCVTALNVYPLLSSVEDIQREIMLYGPVQASFTVYADFSTYKGGIYVHTAGARRGGHAIKIIGWGVEKGIPYWLVSNSWNSDWGENGLFRIARGKNECGIESRVVAGMMKV
ncbi:papain family cysteine protease [Oesophagostomum dentatum]|uniref:Papain family cysteine protease n=1 Tax=Oesophagostomum dentatum TaxID=61180 RepID=A0A0B1TCE9_OESDE|nr:papain family cysteine protease [Oesophagostomum dentatum]